MLHKLLTGILLLTALPAQSQSISIDREIGFKILDSLHTLTSVRAHETDLVAYTDSLAKKLSLCEQLDAKNVSIQSDMEKAMDKFIELRDLDRIKTDGYKQEIKDLQHIVTAKKIKIAGLEVAIGVGVGYYVYTKLK